MAVFLTKNETREYKNKNVINLSFGKFREGNTNQTIKLSRHANFPQFEPLIENDQFKEREVKQDYRTQ